MEEKVEKTSADAVLRDRFRGVLVGVAAGDALGATLEFQPARDPEHYLTEMVGGGWLRLKPGEWTDDTQLTVATVESLLHRRVFDPDDMARRFAVWFLSNPPDVGAHTSYVLGAVANGKPWEEASEDAQQRTPDNAPNGSLMRCSPLALYLYNNPDYLAELSPVLSRITHAHPDCEGACVFQNVAVAWLLMGHKPEEAVQAAYEACDGATNALRQRIERAMEPVNKRSPSGWVLDTLEVALWAFLHTSTFEAAVVEAINRGDDADTVGAVVGALAGARYGYSGIPQRWLDVLQEREQLVAYADRLLELAQSFS